MIAPGPSGASVTRYASAGSPATRCGATLTTEAPFTLNEGDRLREVRDRPVEGQQDRRIVTRAGVEHGRVATGHEPRRQLRPVIHQRVRRHDGAPDPVVRGIHLQPFPAGVRIDLGDDVRRRRRARVRADPSPADQPVAVVQELNVAGQVAELALGAAQRMVAHEHRLAVRQVEGVFHAAAVLAAGAEQVLARPGTLSALHAVVVEDQGCRWAPAPPRAARRTVSRGPR